MSGDTQQEEYVKIHHTDIVSDCQKMIDKIDNILQDITDEKENVDKIRDELKEYHKKLAETVAKRNTNANDNDNDKKMNDISETEMDDDYVVVSKESYMTYLLNYIIDLAPSIKSITEWRLSETLFSVFNKLGKHKEIKEKQSGDIDNKNDNENEIKIDVMSDNNMNDDKTHLENKRMVRLSINNKLLICLKVIFNQTISKLDCLHNDEFIQLTNKFESSINKEYEICNNNVNEFIEKYTENEYSIEIKTDEYIGYAVIKFKNNSENNGKVWAVCCVKTKRYSSTDDINSIKNEIKNAIKAEINKELL
eukprot:112303_1